MKTILVWVGGFLLAITIIVLVVTAFVKLSDENIDIEVKLMEEGKLNDDLDFIKEGCNYEILLSDSLNVDIHRFTDEEGNVFILWDGHNYNGGIVQVR